MVSKLVPYRKDIIVKLCLGKGELEPQVGSPNSFTLIARWSVIRFRELSVE